MITPEPSLFVQNPVGNEITQDSLDQELMAQSHWQGRYRILMKLGQRMEKLEAKLQQEDAAVSGCESATWLYHLEQNGKHYWIADSEARIVRGLLVLVLAACNGKTQTELKQLGLDQWFEKLGLSDHLSPSRANGLNAVLVKIRAVANA